MSHAEITPIEFQNRYSREIRFAMFGGNQFPDKVLLVQPDVLGNADQTITRDQYLARTNKERG